MSCSSCLSSTRVFFLGLLSMVLMITGLGMLGVVGYYGLEISKSWSPSIYIGGGVGFVTFLFPAIVLGGKYKSRCYLIFDNIIMILLSIAECVFVGLYFIPNTVDVVKKILNLPEQYYEWLTNHMTIAAIVGGCLIGVQFLFIILSGIHASELKRNVEEDDFVLPLTKEEAPQRTYREKAVEKYNLDKYSD